MRSMGLGPHTLLLAVQKGLTMLSCVFSLSVKIAHHLSLIFVPIFSPYTELFNIMGVFSNIDAVFTQIQLSNKSVSGRFSLGHKHHGGNKPYIHVSSCYNMLIDA